MTTQIGHWIDGRRTPGTSGRQATTRSPLTPKTYKTAGGANRHREARDHRDPYPVRHHDRAVRRRPADLVDPDDLRFGWQEDGRPKWAWPVQWVEVYRQPLPTGFRAGIRYARAVKILRPSVALLEMLAR